MNTLFRGLVATACLAASAPGALLAQESKDRPRINLRAQPSVSVAPSRVVMTVELVGGSDDYEDFYCPTIEWEWGDDTTSESRSDCDPYLPGTSAIRRRFTVERRFELDGTFQVYVRFKQGEREVGAASTTVTVQPGALR
jgi:hypothetical protein